MLSEKKLLKVPCYNGEEGIQGCKEIAMLRWIYPVRFTNPHYPREDPEDTPFATAQRNALFRGVFASFRSSLMAVLCRPGILASFI